MEIPAGIKQSKDKRGTAHRQQYRVVDRSSDGFTFERQGARTKVMLDGQMLRWATAERVSQEFLDRMKALRDMERKAPRGDSTGCWQKVAEIPVSFLLDRVPPDAWGDERAINKILNSSDFRGFRCDGNHRRL